MKSKPFPIVLLDMIINSKLALVISLGMMFLLALLIWLFFRPNPTPVAVTLAGTAAPQSLVSTPAASDWPSPAGLATFDNRVRLLGLELPAHRFPPGGVVEATLIWQTQVAAPPYAFFLHLLDTDGNLIAQADLALTDNRCAQMGRFSPALALSCGVLLLPEALPEGEYHRLPGCMIPAVGSAC